MDEYIYQYAGSLTKLLELIAAITGLLFLSKYKQTLHKYFIYFLCYVFLLELIGGYTVYVHKIEALSNIKQYLSNTWMRRNNWWYTIFWTIGSALFYSFYFRKFIANKVMKIILKYASITFLVFAIIRIIIRWDDFFVTVLSEVNLFSTILIVTSIVFYLIETLKSERILQFYKSLNIYISISVLLWTVITAPLAFFSIYFNQQDWSYVYLKTNVFFFANIFLYLSFVIGVIVSKPKKLTNEVDSNAFI